MKSRKVKIEIPDVGMCSVEFSDEGIRFKRGRRVLFLPWIKAWQISFAPDGAPAKVHASVLATRQWLAEGSKK